VTDSRVHHGIYNCPNCGAGARLDAVRCAYCNSSLATRICPSCFGAVAVGMSHCPSCGARAAAADEPEHAGGACPRCSADLMLLEAGPRKMEECPKCGGLWIDPATLQQICDDHEQQEAVMNILLVPPVPNAGGPKLPGRIYLPCPKCKKLMNRRNFGGCSGILVDWCKDHGIWFDREELKKAVQFIRGGGLRKSREKEKALLEEEKLHLQEEKRNLARLSRLAGDASSLDPHPGSGPDIFEILMDPQPKLPKI
jgi:Zn-finger nucleic acid-binding protein